MARKLTLENPMAAQVAVPRKATRAASAARRHPVTIARNLRIGSRPNLAQLPSRIKRD